MTRARDESVGRRRIGRRRFLTGLGVGAAGVLTLSDVEAHAVQVEGPVPTSSPDPRFSRMFPLPAFADPRSPAVRDAMVDIGRPGGLLDARVDDILRNGRRWYRFANPTMPVEFQTGAYRFGHSLIRPSYRANLQGDPGGNPATGAPAFFGFVFDPAGQGQADPVDLRGGARARRRFIGWQTFFDFGGDQTQHVRPNKLIDTKSSYLNTGFRPFLPSRSRGTFTITDLLRWAKVDPASRRQ